VGHDQKTGIFGVLRIASVAFVVLVAMVQPVVLAGFAALAAVRAILGEWRARKAVSVASTEMVAPADEFEAAPVLEESARSKAPKDFIGAMAVKYAMKEEASRRKETKKPAVLKPMGALAAIILVALIGGGAALKTNDAAWQVAVQAWAETSQKMMAQAQGFGLAAPEASDVAVAGASELQPGTAEMSLVDEDAATMRAIAPEIGPEVAPLIAVTEAQNDGIRVSQIAAGTLEPAVFLRQRIDLALARVDAWFEIAKTWNAIFWSTRQLVLGVGVMIALFSAGGLLLVAHHRNVAARNGKIDPYKRLLQRRLAEKAGETAPARAGGGLLRA
jgi:hypothetical protein